MEVPNLVEKRNATPISKKGKQENTGVTGWPAVPQSLEQILLEAISKHEGQEDD